MLKKISINHYKSVLDTEMVFTTPFTVLLGKYESGKTNLLEAIDKVHQFAQNNVRNADLLDTSITAQYHNGIFEFSPNSWRKSVTMPKFSYRSSEFETYNVCFPFLVKCRLGTVNQFDKCKAVFEDILFSEISLDKYQCVTVNTLVEKRILDILINIVANNYNSHSKDYEGIAVIDDLDMNLSPEIQLKLIDTLRPHFPNVQFIVSIKNPYNAIFQLEYLSFIRVKRTLGLSTYTLMLFNSDKQEILKKIYQ